MAKSKKTVAKATTKKADAAAPTVPANNNVEQKEESFDKIVAIIAGSNSSVPSQAIVSMLSGLIQGTSKDSEIIARFEESLKNEGVTDEKEKLSRVVLYTCNSFILSLWKTFGNDFKRLYKEVLEKQKAELDAKMSELN